MSARDLGPGADLDVLERAVGADHGVLGDHRGAQELHAGKKRDVGLEDHVGIDPGARRVDDRHALAHPAVEDAPVQLRRERGQLDAVVGTLGLDHVVDAVSADRSALPVGDRDDVGEVVLTLGVVVGDAGDRVGEEGAVEGEDAAVDLADGSLLRGRVLLLDDAGDTPVAVAQDASVAEGSATSAVSTVITRSPAAACASTSAVSVSPCRSGVSPAITTTTPSVVPVASRRLSSATRTAWPVPSWVSCTASSAFGHLLQDVAADLLAAAAHHRDEVLRLDVQGCGEHVRRSCCARTAGAAPSSSWTSCGCRCRPRGPRRLGGGTTARSRSLLPVGERPAAPRVGVEPTSLVRIQSAAGPTDRPTGDRSPVWPACGTVCPTDQPGIARRRSACAHLRARRCRGRAGGTLRLRRLRWRK